MGLAKKIEEMEAKMDKARMRVDFGDDGATHEEMADGYELAFDWAEDVADDAIQLLKGFLPSEDKDNCGGIDGVNDV